MGKPKSYKAFGSKVSIIPWDEINIEGYKTDNCDILTIEASVVTGFECAAKEEVKTKLEITDADVKEFTGRVLFDIKSDKLEQVLNLRTVDNVWIIIGAKADFDLTQSEEEGLATLVDYTLNNLQWTKGLSSWNKIFEFYEDSSGLHNVEKRPKLEKIPNFRCTCYRNGDLHKFSSMHVIRHIGGKVQDKFGWGVKMKGYDIEIVVNIDNNQAYFGLALTKHSLHKRSIEHFGPTTLRATICASMLQLADIQPGEIVCDPMCGGGSIPIEGALAFQNGFFIGGDNHNLAAERTANNLKVFDRKIQADSLQWDVTNIPLKDNSVDVLISDLPFGKRSGSKADNRVLYPQILLSMARVVKPKTGRAVLLTQDKNSMFKSAPKFNKFWKIKSNNYCNIGGLAALVFIMARTEEMP